MFVKGKMNRQDVVRGEGPERWPGLLSFLSSTGSKGTPSAAYVDKRQTPVCQLFMRRVSHTMCLTNREGAGTGDEQAIRI